MQAEMRPALEFPLAPGTDMSGVVQAVAPDVPGFAVGDEVFGMLRFPGFDGRTYTEYVVAPASDLAHKPAGIDHVQAAGAPMVVLTAWQYLVELGHDVPSPFTGQVHRPVPITPGLTVLVNGAADGVGHFAVQPAKWKGAHVVRWPRAGASSSCASSAPMSSSEEALTGYPGAVVLVTYDRALRARFQGGHLGLPETPAEVPCDLDVTSPVARRRR